VRDLTEKPTHVICDDVQRTTGFDCVLHKLHRTRLRAALDYFHHRCTKTDILYCSNTHKIAGEGDHKNRPPDHILAFNVSAEAPEEQQERKLDGPEAGEEEDKDDDGPLVITLAVVEDGHRWPLMTDIHSYMSLAITCQATAVSSRSTQATMTQVSSQYSFLNVCQRAQSLSAMKGKQAMTLAHAIL